LNNATFFVAGDETSTLSGVLTSEEGAPGGVTKTGAGRLVLTGDNTYVGPTEVQAGILELAAVGGSAAGSTASVSVATGATLLLSQSDQVNNSATVSLSGGTITRGSGVSEVFGNLNLTAASFLDFGSGAVGTLSFGTYTPSSLLTVENFFEGNVLTFGSNLTASIKDGSMFSFDNGFTSSWNEGTSTFTITAIPEPSTYAAAAGLLAMMLWPARRRFLQTLVAALGQSRTATSLRRH
jgi:autotransporter-associated beta strand protein